MPSSGNTVCAPLIGGRSRRAICGARRFSGVDSFGPFNNFSRSTICSAPFSLVP
jgi:hypothetical protein